MCYSEFGDIIQYLVKLDFDVLLIEASRSNGKIINQFINSGFDRQLGPGVWDIHSPAIPQIDKMAQIINLVLKIFDKSDIWINPDCGLKTRAWPETTESLKNLVNLAKKLRETI